MKFTARRILLIGLAGVMAAAVMVALVDAWLTSGPPAERPSGDDLRATRSAADESASARHPTGDDASRTPSSTRIPLPESDDESPDPEFEQSVSTLIRGTASTEAGQPIEPYDVTLWLDGVSSSSPSDGQGRFTFRLDQLQPGQQIEAVLQFRACGFTLAEQSVTLRGGQQHQVTVTLEPAAGPLAGTVVDALGQPIVDVRVVVTSSNATAGVEFARTDAAGRYAIRCARNDDVLSMRFLHPAFLERSLQPADIAGDWNDLQVVLQPGCVFTGVVLDEWDKPAPGVSVQAVVDQPDSEDEARFQRNAVSDASGAFTLTGLPPGVVELGFWRPAARPGSPPGLTEWVVVAPESEGGQSGNASFSLPPGTD